MGHPSTGGEPCSFASLMQEGNKNNRLMTTAISVLNIFHPSTGGLGVVKISFTPPQGDLVLLKYLSPIHRGRTLLICLIKKKVNDTHTFCTKYLSPIHGGLGVVKISFTHPQGGEP